MQALINGFIAGRMMAEADWDEANAFMDQANANIDYLNDFVARQHAELTAVKAELARKNRELAASNKRIEQGAEVQKKTWLMRSETADALAQANQKLAAKDAEIEAIKARAQDRIESLQRLTKATDDYRELFEKRVEVLQKRIASLTRNLGVSESSFAGMAAVVEAFEEAHSESPVMATGDALFSTGPQKGEPKSQANLIFEAAYLAEAEAKGIEDPRRYISC